MPIRPDGGEAAVQSLESRQAQAIVEARLAGARLQLQVAVVDPLGGGPGDGKCRQVEPVLERVRSMPSDVRTPSPLLARQLPSKARSLCVSVAMNEPGRARTVASSDSAP